MFSLYRFEKLSRSVSFISFIEQQQRAVMWHQIQSINQPTPPSPKGPLVVLPAHLSTNPDTFTVLLMASLGNPEGLSANLLTEMLLGQQQRSCLYQA